MSSPMVITGTLPIGVLVGSRLCREVGLRGAIVQDNIDAIEEVGTANPVALSAAILARQIVTLGDLNGTVLAKVDSALLRGMHVSDFNALEELAAALEKKLRLGCTTSGGGQSSESHWPATVSAPTTSPA